MLLFTIGIISLVALVISNYGLLNYNKNLWANMTEKDLNKLILKGFNINQKDSKGATPLMYVSGLNKDPKIIEILIKKGANVNDTNMIGFTALHYAVNYSQNYKTAETLLKNGALIDYKDRNGFTPLISCCVRNSNYKFVEILLKYGADIDAIDIFKRTALEIISEQDSPNAKKIANLLNKIKKSRGNS